MLQHMVVPLDGRALAEQALPIAARIVRGTSGSVLLVQVVSEPIDDSGVEQEGLGTYILVAMSTHGRGGLSRWMRAA